jgi:endonuclease-3
VLSAQTTDARVNIVTPALFARADTPAKMARLDVAEIHALIQTCGLAPAKAKNIAALSKLLVEKHGGKVPRTFEELEALPGVGHKTASVVMAQAFGIPRSRSTRTSIASPKRWGLSDRILGRAHGARSQGRVPDRFVDRDAPEDHPLRPRALPGALRHDMSQCPICSFAATKEKIRASTPPEAGLARRSFGGAAAPNSSV